MLLAVTQQWLVVSDLHLDPYDRSSSPARYKSDTNWALFNPTLAQMRKAAPDAQVVIISGDLLAHHFDQRVQSAGRNQDTASAALHTMAAIESAFERSFPHAQFLITMGNNDDPCGDYRTAPNTAYLAQLARIWAPLVNRRGAAPTFTRDFSRTGSYTAHLPGRLRAVVVDDVYWSLFFQPCSRGAVNMPSSEMNWFARTLSSIPSSERSFVLLHIPPGIDPTSTLIARRFLVVPFWRDDMRKRFMDILNANAGRVSAVLAGHMHRTDFRLVSGVPLLIAPSVSPVYSNNPAFLTLQMGLDGTIRDYQMYAYAPNVQRWSRIFDFDSVYGVDGFTPKGLAIAHERIARDPAIQDRWLDAIVADSNKFELQGAWRAFWCAQTYFAGNYATCAGDQRRVTILRAVALLVVSVVVLAIILLIVRLARQRPRV